MLKAAKTVAARRAANEAPTDQPIFLPSDPPPSQQMTGLDLTDFRRFVDLIEGRAMACDGPVTPFLDELAVASDEEKNRFVSILRSLYQSKNENGGNLQ